MTTANHNSNNSKLSFINSLHREVTLVQDIQVGQLTYHLITKTAFSSQPTFVPTKLRPSETVNQPLK